MLWVKAFHIIFMVSWFSGIFYLPRLFVYHSQANDLISIERFKVMEKKLYYMILMPAAILTVSFGFWLLSYNFSGYLHSKWMQLKLCVVLCLVGYHLYLGKLLKDFKYNRNQHSHVFYRFLNEIPVLFLVSIVFLVVLKPF